MKRKNTAGVYEVNNPADIYEIETPNVLLVWTLEVLVQLCPVGEYFVMYRQFYSLLQKEYLEDAILRLAPHTRLSIQPSSLRSWPVHGLIEFAN